MISVIIPIYNAEPYLKRCIDSILEQTYRNFELILVDDGSNDKSLEICKKYSDNRIIIVHKKNEGVSSARNLGIDISKGEWIIFIDADDWIDVNTFEICMKHSAEADIIRFSMVFAYSLNPENHVKYNLPHANSKNEYLKQLIERKTILGICGGIYRNDLFKSNKILFNPILINGEDWLVLFQIAFYSKNISIINYPLYYYNKFNYLSCINNLNLEKQLSSIYAFRLIIEKVSNSCEFKSSIIKGKIEVLNNALMMLLSQSVNFHDFYKGIITIKQLISIPEFKEIVSVNLSLKKKLIFISFFNIFFASLILLFYQLKKYKISIYSFSKNVLK